MPRIKGRFAPLTEELGSDERFLIGCTDLEKLLYVLIIYTCHMTRHQAPIDPIYYQRRFILRARKHQISTAIEALCKRFPKLKCSNGKLSLLNSATYETEILPKCPIEVEEEKDIEVKKDSKTTAIAVQRPTIELVSSYFSELSAVEEAPAFFDHFQSNGWKVGGKTPMKDWKAACRNWLRSPYRKNTKKLFRGKQEMIDTATELAKEMKTW